MSLPDEDVVDADDDDEDDEDEEEDDDEDEAECNICCEVELGRVVG